MLKKKLDFLPNKLNKYSIRRFTVGTASILVGSTLLFGIGNEAHAAEEHQKSNTTENVADSNASEAPTKKKRQAMKQQAKHQQKKKCQAMKQQAKHQQKKKRQAMKQQVRHQQRRSAKQ